MGLNGAPARIHVLFARDSEKAVVVRRGPSKSVCTVAWNRRNDTFALGQWFHGRIYERRSDLSPDGKYLIYFASDGCWNSYLKGSWTAISRAPYLKAIGLWAKGDCWNGGGLFTSPNRYWLNDGCGHDLRLAPTKLEREDRYPGAGGYGGECPGVYYLRLQRDGWRFQGKQGAGRLNEFAVFDKEMGDSWVLRKLAHETLANSTQGRGCYFDEHELHNVGSDEIIRCPDWQWAEVDRNRLVWAQHGKLFTSSLPKSGLPEPTELHDFNDKVFQALEAPY